MTSVTDENWIKNHDFDTGKYCTNPECHFVYHYSCADCGTDCTQGTAGGPATREIDGVTRCWKCNQKLPRFHAVGKAAVIAKAAPEMLEALGNIRILIDTFYHNSGWSVNEVLGQIRAQALAAERKARGVE